MLDAIRYAVVYDALQWGRSVNAAETGWRGGADGAVVEGFNGAAALTLRKRAEIRTV